MFEAVLCIIAEFILVNLYQPIYTVLLLFDATTIDNAIMTVAEIYHLSSCVTVLYNSPRFRV